MSASLSIQLDQGLDQGAGPLVPAGGRVSGTVNLEALSQLDEKELVLVLVGLEEVSWEDATVLNGNSATQHQDKEELFQARVVLRSWVGGVPCVPGQYSVPFDVHLPEHLTPTFSFFEAGTSTSSRRRLKASVSYHLDAFLVNSTTDRPTGGGLRASALNASASLRALGRALSSRGRTSTGGGSPTGSRKAITLARLPSLAAAEAHARLPLVVEEVVPVFTLSDTCVCYMSDSGSIKLRVEVDKDLVKPGEVLEVATEADGSKTQMAFPKLTLEAGILVQLHDRHAAGETASAADFTPLLRHDLAGLYPSHLARLMEKLGANGAGGKSKAASRFSMRMPPDLGPSVRGQLVTRCLAVRLIASPDDREVLAAMRPTAVARVWLDSEPPRSVDPAGVLVHVA
eukprot:XP_001698809.1 predicted protein [Chlamydomonas reinhardtii]